MKTTIPVLLFALASVLGVASDAILAACPAGKSADECALEARRILLPYDGQGGTPEAGDEHIKEELAEGINKEEADEAWDFANCVTQQSGCTLPIP